MHRLRAISGRATEKLFGKPSTRHPPLPRMNSSFTLVIGSLVFMAVAFSGDEFLNAHIVYVALIGAVLAYVAANHMFREALEKRNTRMAMPLLEVLSASDEGALTDIYKRRLKCISLNFLLLASATVIFSFVGLPVLFTLIFAGFAFAAAKDLIGANGEFHKFQSLIRAGARSKGPTGDLLSQYEAMRENTDFRPPQVSEDEKFFEKFSLAISWICAATGAAAMYAFSDALEFGEQREMNFFAAGVLLLIQGLSDVYSIREGGEYELPERLYEYNDEEAEIETTD